MHSVVHLGSLEDNIWGFSPSTMWVPGTEFKLSGFMASDFTCPVISLGLTVVFVEIHI